jgi:hypothetical protein
VLGRNSGCLETERTSWFYWYHRVSNP